MMARRFGAFGRIATAIRESQDDLRQWVHDRPLRAGVLIAASYGIAIVLAKHLVVIALQALWSPWLAVAAEAAIGAVVAAPQMFANLARRIAGHRLKRRSSRRTDRFGDYFRHEATNATYLTTAPSVPVIRYDYGH